MVKINFEQDNQRAVAYDGETFVGECTYSASKGLWIIDHTFVEEAYGGQGIAKQLVEKVVEEARKAEVKIMPLCPFAKREFMQREDYQDIWAR